MYIFMAARWILIGGVSGEVGEDDGDGEGGSDREGLGEGEDDGEGNALSGLSSRDGQVERARYAFSRSMRSLMFVIDMAGMAETLKAKLRGKAKILIIDVTFMMKRGCFSRLLYESSKMSIHHSVYLSLAFLNLYITRN